MSYDFGRDRGNIQGHLTWLLLENMRLSLNSDYSGLKYDNHIEGELFYLNPGRAFRFLSLGGRSDLNHIWT